VATPTERIAALCVGTVESVSPDEVRVLLNAEAPQTVALNTGVPTPFPRVNSYVVIPNESGAVVGLVVFLGVERSPIPRKVGVRDAGLVDLPFPLRKLHVTPLGTLRRRGTMGDPTHFEFARGVVVFPSVGDQVLIPTIEQLKAIVEAGGENRRVCIGSSPLAGNSPVFVDPDKLFGRHLAVLGNTGSGKSCSVAGLIRWSIDAASSAAHGAGRDPRPNARFIVLDPNGEYLETFRSFNPRVFQVGEGSVSGGAAPLRVPAWLWNSAEWAAFVQAAPRIQRPLLLEALRLIRSGTPLEDTKAHRMAGLFAGRKAHLETLLGKGPSAYSEFPQSKNVAEVLRRLGEEAEQHSAATSGDIHEHLLAVQECVAAVLARREYTYGKGLRGINALGEADLKEPVAALDGLMPLLPRVSLSSEAAEDTPIRFDVSQFAAYIESLASMEVAGNEQHTANLVWRVRSLLSDGRLRAVIGNESDVEFSKWLAEIIGTDGTDSQVTVIDLSLVPTEIVHVVISVLARLVFEAVQRYRRKHGTELPTVLVLEEAHTFISRGRAGVDDGVLTPSDMCRATFERIAREGRKFGLGLLLSSQRPFELSATVLAQCNTFLLHRIVNDQDQELVQKLVPDNVRGILHELPSLPSGQAILLGWAAVVPVLVAMKRLPPEEQPRSNDPAYWRVWTREDARTVDWSTLVDGWINKVGPN
jgi:hypothetical protein